MRHYKETFGGYLLSVGVGNGFEEITENEYDTILSLIHNKPRATETTDYRLREDLTWEEYEVEPPDPDPDIDDAELLNILMGGATE